MKEKYPHYIMRNVRLNLGLDATDTSMDEEINNMSRREVFDRYLIWEGIINYTEEILSVIESIYDTYLEE